MAISSKAFMVVVVFPLLVCFLLSTVSASPLPNSTQLLLCNETEKQALLSFKQALSDPLNALSSWSVQHHPDCCQYWYGVYCHNITGRVIGLDLAGCSLGGKVSPALLQFEFLNHLDLSGNDFGGSPIPTFLGSIRSLTHLYLSGASFGGLIPPHLGNLSNLHSLSLGVDYHEPPPPPLYVENLKWISRLSSLEDLYMYGVDLHRAVDWLESINMLSSLSWLGLEYCNLDNMDLSPESINFTSLTRLDLRGNHFDHEMPHWVFNLLRLNFLALPGNRLRGQIPEYVGQLKHLESLSLGDNSLDGPIPSSIGNLSSLRYLGLSANRLNGTLPNSLNFPRSLYILELPDNRLRGQIPEYVGQLEDLEYLGLGDNSLDGPIPSSIGNLSSLRDLDLSGNRLNGTLPSSLWLLSNLEGLRIGNNSFAGTISEVHFNKLSKLWWLDISYLPYLVFKVDPNWVPPFQLKRLLMLSSQMGPGFPVWLQTQTSLRYLDISDSGIVDSAPAWFWKWASHLDYLDLSNNQISGNLYGVLLNNSYIDLSSNYFEGALPRLSSNVVVFKMANNSFSGSISDFLCQKMNGGSQLMILDMSTNRLVGEISDCWKYWPSLTYLNLGNNYLSGKIPESMASLFKLEALHLHNNHLFGNIPPSLQNCTSLGLLDLGVNKFSGSMPSWLQEMTTLMVLRLRSNGLKGNIPPQICQLSSIIVLDFAENNLSGTIPKCFNNFTSMTTTSAKYDPFSALENHKYKQSYESVMLVIKGRESEYKSILKLVRTIDLSSNNISGLIPNEISSLSTLQSLNLSFNHLMGKIPEAIGSMQFLECLDLSRNHLSSEIPQSMTNLTLLHDLDLSYNNFSGRIPLSTQLQSFDAVNYIGNVELCGAPLANNCREDEEHKDMGTIDKNKAGSKISWFYIGMVFGFVVGFWGVCGLLILKRSWRYAYFQFVNHVMDSMYLAIVTKWKWLQNIVREDMED